MLATVMMMREGGVDKAMEAVPTLHDTTHAYIKTMSLAEKHPEWFAKNGTKAADWGGLKDGDLDLLKTIKETNATAKEDDFLTELGDKIEAKLGGKEKNATKDWETEKVEQFEKMLPQVRELERGERERERERESGEKRWRGGERGGGEKRGGGQREAWPPSRKGIPLTHTHSLCLTLFCLSQDKAAEDAEFLEALNKKLEKYNIVVSPPSVAAPSKFSNGAATIVKAITGVALSKTGINFAPCLVSYAPAGVSVGAQLVNIVPQGVGFAPTGVSIAAQGVNVQPALILVQPIGANVQPQGMQVAPFLIAVSPVGVNVQPQGANIAPVGTAISPTGTAIVPQGKVYAPVDRAYAPVGVDLTPPKE